MMEFRCEARVTFNGRQLALDRIIAHVDIEEIMPSRGPFLHPYDVVDANKRDERRRRFIDFIAAEFAHALTEALYKAHKRETA